MTTSGDALSALSATELAVLVRTRKISPVDIVDDLLARLDVANPVLNAFVVLDRDGARRAARAFLEAQTFHARPPALNA